MSTDSFPILLMVGLFILMVIVMIAANYYTKKYKTKITGSQIIIYFFIFITVVIYFLIKNMAVNEKDGIIKNVALNTTVIAITFDTHKPYFKNMHLADSRYLPMPEAMNTVLQIGDSIYKNKGEKFYTVVNSITKSRKNFDVKVHHREFTMPQ